MEVSTKNSLDNGAELCPLEEHAEVAVLVAPVVPAHAQVPVAEPAAPAQRADRHVLQDVPETDSMVSVYLASGGPKELTDSAVPWRSSAAF